MKLVQLLAKELKEWPLGLDGDPSLFLTQEGDGWLRSWDDNGELSFNGHSWSMKGTIPCEDFGMLEENLASDLSKAIITKDQWQAEREKMNEPKWIRHRGGKCPVADDVKVLYRMRSGTITSRGEPSSILSWDHSKSGADIMAYRVIEETKDREIEEVKKTNFGTLTYKLEIDATEATQRIDSLVAKWGQIESPLKWRDAIIHCQAIIEDCEREIERNVNLLDAEGLMMQKDSKKAMQHYAPDVDMSDWRNWQAGDVIEIVANEGGHQFENGEEVIVVFLDLNDIDMSVKAEYKDGSDYWWLSGKDAKFIRRP